MTPESQRIAIAEACGWKGVWKSDHNGKLYGLEPSEVRAPELPDYLNDLNAMHEAEKRLTIRQIRDMTIHLHDIMTETPKLDLVPLHHAAAAQRAEAFLRAIGKWNDNK